MHSLHRFRFDFGNRPFLSPHRDKHSHERTTRKRTPKQYFTIEEQKHPVSLLYEYCSLQHIHPTFSFYEISQVHQIEYGCIVTIENFFGEGRSFSKKTAKHEAAANLLWKLMQPDYVGEQEISTKRFVSETGVVSVHYEDAPSVRRSCFRSPTESRGMKKKVKWEETESEIYYDSSPEQEASEPESEEEREDESPDISKEEKGKNEDSLPEVGEIDDYLSERLLKTNISLTSSSPVQAEQEIEASDEEVLEFRINDEPKNKRKNSNEEILEVKLNSEPKKIKKRKSSSPVLYEAAFSLKRKVCLREMNPIGYLQEACQQLKIPVPTYISMKESGKYKALCILEDHKVHAEGATSKQAKKAAASLMIDHRGW